MYVLGVQLYLFQTERGPAQPAKTNKAANINKQTKQREQQAIQQQAARKTQVDT